ncbi:MAG: cupin domain-containing protein [Anaerolineae bacterium]|nr:cupin domain-containing protein [Anaerolineae bacterium]
MPVTESGSQPAPQIKNLKNLLQFQPASIVSRVLLKNPGGTVTLFAFGQGEGLSEHTAPFDALVICVEGDAQIVIAGNQYNLREGETITMPANQPHAIHAASDFKMLLVMLKT